LKEGKANDVNVCEIDVVKEREILPPEEHFKA